MNYKLKYTNRSKTISIQVTPNMEVLVSAPKRMDKNEIDKFILEKARWIEKKLEHFESRQIEFSDKTYKDDEVHLFLGQQYALEIVSAESDKVVLKDNKLVVYNTRLTNQFSTKTLVQLWYREQAYMYISSRADELFNLFQPEIQAKPKIEFKKMTRKWGMCNSNGKVTLNPELIKKQPECIDYVIIHEFCHLLEHNHSKRFYAWLDIKMPLWKKWKKVLG